MRTINILGLQRISPRDLAKVEATDAAIRYVDAAGWFDGEIRETWPEYTANRFLPPDATGQGTREERDRMLAEAEVIVGGWPFPLDLRSRAPQLKWLHQRQAGASNLIGSDLWGSDVVVTTSRGAANPLPIAEYAVAGIMHFAMGLHRAAIDREAGRFDHRAYRSWLLQGKTVCVIGAGGIGQEVGRLCAALGMRVIGTRRQPGGALPEGFSEISGPDQLDALLAAADVVAVCCQWTPETTGLMNHTRFTVMKPGAILVNVARGEIIDENALADALARDRLRGVVLDVYVGEFDHPPPERLWSDPRVLITPHISGWSDAEIHGGVDVFCDNLRAYRERRPLRNVLDWERGY
ncbi:MAG: D-2-hydroxyacid dehydrogenase [Alphaproteobacteria bacterium]|nr:D-2-hydroxyacid dehydrogenase [Alphaproteobacteria bacterium]